MKTTKLAYVSGALSDVPEGVRNSYLSFYETIGKRIEACGLLAYIPHLNTDPVRHKNVTPGEVDLIDRRAVTSAALVVAVVDNPSLGVGIEIEMAYHAAKPVVLIAKKDLIDTRRISRLVRGNPTIVHEIVYTTEQDAFDQLTTFIGEFLREEAASILPTVLQARPAA